MLCLSLAGFRSAADASSGRWTGEWGPNAIERNRVLAELKYDGKVVTGSFNSGFGSATISKGTFNEKTRVIHLEAEGRGRGSARIHYVIDGKLDGGKITHPSKHQNTNHDFTINITY